MPLQFEEVADGKVLEAHLSGKLTDKDYERIVPEVEHIIQQHGKIRMLAEMHDFHGWSARGLWEEMKLDLRHMKDLERLAIVGEKRWHEWMGLFCQPIIPGRVRYFDQSHMAEAREWIQNN